MDGADVVLPVWFAKAHEWRARLAWTAKDLATLGVPGLPTTEFRMREFLLREAGKGTVTRARGRGGIVLTWHRLAMPAALRMAITKHIDSEMLRLGFVAPQTATEDNTREARRFDRLPPKAAQRAGARADIVSAWRIWRDRTGRFGWRGMEAFCDLYRRDQIPIHEMVVRLVPSVCAASLAAWEERDEARGWVGLSGDYRPREKAIERDPALATTFDGAIAAFPQIRAGQMRDILRAKHPGLALPTLRSVQRWLAAWKAKNRTLHAHLDDPDKAKSRSRVSFGTAAVGAINARWEIDATPADLLLADGKRYTLLGLIDVGTRRMRLIVAEHSSGVAVGLLLRRCLLEFGIPGTVGTDNGAEFVGQHIKRVFSDLRINHDIAPPFSPEAKPYIERAFRTFSHDLIELMPGFVGHNVAERAAIRARRSFADRLMGAGRRSEVEMSVSAEALQAFCDAWCRDRYERRGHSGLNGRSPFEAAQAQAGAVLKIANERALDVLLAPAASGGGWRVVGKKGIRLARGTFIAAELGLLIGQTVECREDPADAGRIYVFREDGTFACVAEDPERTGIDRRELAIAARRLQAAELARQRQALREAKAKARIDPATIVQEILAADARDAAKVIALPQAPEMFTTPALEEAGRAARADDAPVAPPRSEADARAGQHLVDLTERLNARRAARIAQDERTEAEARIRRGFRCRDLIIAQTKVPADEIAWFAGYETSSEFSWAMASRRGIDIRPGFYVRLAPKAMPDTPSETTTSQD